MEDPNELRYPGISREQARRIKHTNSWKLRLRKYSPREVLPLETMDEDLLSRGVLEVHSRSHNKATDVTTYMVKVNSRAVRMRYWEPSRKYNPPVAKSSRPETVLFGRLAHYGGLDALHDLPVTFLDQDNDLIGRGLIEMSPPPGREALITGKGRELIRELRRRGFSGD